MSRHIGPMGRTLIKKWEGIEDGDPRTAKLDPYLCPANVWTIGWGHAIVDHRGVQIKGAANRNAAYAMYPGGITLEQAELLLIADLIPREKLLDTLVGEATPAQFSAMGALYFNIGHANFVKSSVLRHHVNGRFAHAADAFRLFNKARVNGKLVVLRGLTSRREDERALYLMGLQA